jgi:hypothetical protein
MRELRKGDFAEKVGWQRVAVDCVLRMRSRRPASTAGSAGALHRRGHQ